MFNKLLGGGPINGDWAGEKINLTSEKASVTATVVLTLSIKEATGVIAGSAKAKFWQSVTDNETEIPLPIQGKINDKKEVNFTLVGGALNIQFDGTLNEDGNQIEGTMTVNKYKSVNVVFKKN